MQRTLSQAIHLSGVGLHSGATINLSVRPAPVAHGIVFKRLDVEGAAATVAATYVNVSDTTLCTVIENGYGTKVGTVEHLMAALWGMGIDNALIELDGAEVPIMDGSSEPFITLIDCVGTVAQNAPRQYIVIDRPILIEDGESLALIEPYDGFALDATIAFAHASIGIQRGVYEFDDSTFRSTLSRARTFGFSSDVERLRAMGLARGGSLANAIVVGEDGVLNEDGLRFADEFVRHKALDCVGDYFMAGHRLRGRVTTRKPGHRLNNKLIKAIYAHRSAWHFESSEQVETILPVTAMVSPRRIAGAMPSAAVHQADK